jgi:serine protease AprX
MIVTGPCGSDTVTQIISITVGLDEAQQASAVALAAYPNPSSGSTTVTYYVPERTTVAVELYSLVGQKVYSVDMGTQDKGKHETSIDLNEGKLPAGAYLMRLQTAAGAATLRIVKLN